MNGILTEGPRNGRNAPESYTQFYRNGIIEAATANIVKGYDNQIPRKKLEEEIISGIRRYLSLCDAMDIHLPVFLFFSLARIYGYKLAIPERFQYQNSNHFLKENTISMPKLILENYQTDVSIFLKPWFDCLHNAFGYKESFSYENGKYIYD